MDNLEFPSIKKTIDDFINDDDGNITRNQLVTIGAMIREYESFSVKTE